MYIYGGMNLHSYLSDFWKLDLVKLEWIQLETDYNDRSLKVVSGHREKLDRTPSLASHTLTFNPDSKSLILFGGYSSLHGYNPHVFEYQLLEDMWQIVVSMALGPEEYMVTQRFIILPQRPSIYLGGNVFQANSSFMSNILWTFHYPTRTWSIVPYDQSRSKALHHLKNGLNYFIFLIN